MTETVVGQWMWRQSSVSAAKSGVVLKYFISKDRHGVLRLHYLTLDIHNGLHALLVTSSEDFINAVVQK